MALHCPECGFLNADGANYCQKCGAYLGDLQAPEAESSTATYRIDEATGELVPVELEQFVEREGAALVVRAGGGREGESFALDGGLLFIAAVLLLIGWISDRRARNRYEAPPI